MSRNRQSRAPDARIDDSDRIRWVTLRLDQIQTAPLPDALIWSDHCGYLPGVAPAVRPKALPVLQLLNPLLVTPIDNEPASKRTYRLCGGRRTFQLLVEQLPLVTRVRAVVVPDLNDLPDVDLFDTVILRLINSPDQRTRSVTAASLTDKKELREKVNTYLDIDGQAELGAYLDVSRQTLHRMVIDGRSGLSKLDAVAAAPTVKSPLSILNESEPEL